MMKIILYGTQQDCEDFQKQVGKSPPLAFRQIEYNACRDYDGFIRDLRAPCDAVFVLADGADGMEGVIAARDLKPDTPLVWFSDDKGFGPQSYRVKCAYFAPKPLTPDKLQTAFALCGLQ